MDRFDKDFHDSDSISGRPFSFGHPDGVWIICILYGLLLFAALLLLIFALVVPPIDLVKIVPSIAAIGIIAPYILLYRKRSKIVIIYGSVLLIFYSAGAIMSIGLSDASVLPLAGLAGAQAVIVYYSNSLKNDDILT